MVEDDPAVRATIARHLARAGMEVSTAATGPAGLEAAVRLRGTLDAIVLDLKLPGLSGLEVLRRLRSDGDVTPVLVLTGYATIQTAFEVGTHPRTAYQEKPVRPAVLVAAVRGIVGASDRPVAGDGSSNAPPDQPDAGTCLAALAALRSSRAAVGRGAPTDRDPLLRALLEVIVHPQASFFVVIAACRSFREVRKASEDRIDRLLPVVRGWLVTAASRRWAEADPRLRPLAALLGSSDSGGRLGEKASLTERVGLGEGELDALLGREIGVSAADLRLVVRVRLVVMTLLATEEHVAQIGYAHGYSHPSQVNHDVRRLLGVSPRELRGLQSGAAPTTREEPRPAD